MKILVAVFSSLLLCALAHASSKYAGDYYAISTDDNPLRPGPELVAGVNLTVHDDGSLTGRGAYIERVDYFGLTPVTITGKVKDSGEVILVETSGGHEIRSKAQFDPGGQQFSLALPSGFFTVGQRIARDFPQAGVYHARTDSVEEAIFFLRRDGSVFGIVFEPNGDLFDVEGQATPTGFSARSAAGASFDGQFDGTDISGGYSPNAIEPLSLPFTGAKY